MAQRAPRGRLAQRAPYDSPHAAAARGDLDALARFASRGWSTAAAVRAARHAAEAGHLHVLQWLHGQGARLGSLDLCLYAAINGDLPMLQWATQLGFRPSCILWVTAAYGARMDLLQWAHANRTPGGSDLTKYAAMAGNMSVLQWARDHRYPWAPNTASTAARWGNIAALRWAIEHGCPWDEQTCCEAAAGGHFVLLMWANTHGAPWTDSALPADDSYVWNQEGPFCYTALRWLEAAHRLFLPQKARLWLHTVDVRLPEVLPRDLATLVKGYL